MSPFLRAELDVRDLLDRVATGLVCPAPVQNVGLPGSACRNHRAPHVDMGASHRNLLHHGLNAQVTAAGVHRCAPLSQSHSWYVILGNV